MSVHPASEVRPGLGRTIYAKLPAGTDMMAGIREVCAEHGIRSGVILCCMGSLAHAHFEYGKATKTPTAEAPLHVEGPLSLLPCQGIVSSLGDKGHFVHLHGSVQTNDLRVYGQHFAQEGSTVFNLVELVIADLGMPLETVHDPEIDAPVTRIVAG